VLVEAQHLERRVRFVLAPAAVVLVVARRRFLPLVLAMLFELDAVPVTIPVGQIDDAHRTAGLVDPVHQAAGPQDFVVRMRGDHQQSGVPGDGQRLRHRSSREERKQRNDESAGHVCG
jgi:hypothetical protein